MGKCLAADSELVCQDGSIKTIEEIYHCQQDSLLTLKANWRFSWTKPSAFVDDGIKPVYQVITRLGRKITTTLTHPFLTIQGWQSLATLQVGNKIAVPRQIQVSGNGVISQAKLKLLAYLIGDGCFTQRCKDEEREKKDLDLDFDRSLTLWLQELGLWGKNAHQKSIPKLIFTLKPDLIAKLVCGHLYT